MSKHPYVRKIPDKCNRCGGNLARSYDNKFECVSCGRPYNFKEPEVTKDATGKSSDNS